MGKSDKIVIQRRSVKHRTMNIRMTHAGQLFLDAESLVDFMEANLLCVVVSSTIVNEVTELTRKGEMKANVQIDFPSGGYVC